MIECILSMGLTHGLYNIKQASLFHKRWMICLYMLLTWLFLSLLSTDMMWICFSLLYIVYEESRQESNLKLALLEELIFRFGIVGVVILSLIY